MSTLLDTNVVSELMRESPEHSVARWVSDHPVEDLFLSAVSEAECATVPPSSRWVGAARRSSSGLRRC